MRQNRVLKNFINAVLGLYLVGFYRNIMQAVLFAYHKISGLQAGEQVAHQAQPGGGTQQCRAKLIPVGEVRYATAQQQQGAAAHEAVTAVAVVKAFFFVKHRLYILVMKLIAITGGRVQYVHPQAGGHLHNDVFRQPKTIPSDIVYYRLVTTAIGSGKIDLAALEKGFDGFAPFLQRDKIGGLGLGRTNQQQ